MRDLYLIICLLSYLRSAQTIERRQELPHGISQRVRQLRVTEIRLRALEPAGKAAEQHG